MSDDVRATLAEHSAKLDELLALVRTLTGREPELLAPPPGEPAPAPTKPRRPVARPLVQQIESLDGPARDIAARLRIKRVAKLEKQAKRKGRGHV